MGLSLLFTGDNAHARMHLDRAIALYDAAEHRSLATGIDVDTGVSVFSFRSLALWMLGYPEAAVADAEQAIKEAREIGDVATLMYALTIPTWTHVHCGNYDAAKMRSDEAMALADEKGALFWKATGMVIQGCVLTLSGEASNAVSIISSGLVAYRSTGTTIWVPLHLAYLARAFANLGQFDEAWRCIGESMAAIEATNEKWCEAHVYRVAGEIALMPPEHDEARAEQYFTHALVIARAQQARSWELRAATSLARLWHDQRKLGEARDLLAPVYGWFTEGFDTPDLKEAKVLLDELA